MGSWRRLRGPNPQHKEVVVAHWVGSRQHQLRWPSSVSMTALAGSCRPKRSDYSEVSASLGSTRVARRAGTHEATRAMKPSIRGSDVNVSGSVGSMP